MFRNLVVLDTGIYVSHLIRVNSVPGQVVTHVLRTAQPLVSTRLIEELRDVVSRPRMRAYLNADSANRFIDTLCTIADLIHPTVPVSACRDPDDDHILSLAVSGRADVIVTGDQDLLVLHPFQGIPILSPRAFLDRHSAA